MGPEVKKRGTGLGVSTNDASGRSRRWLDTQRCDCGRTGFCSAVHTVRRPEALQTQGSSCSSAKPHTVCAVFAAKVAHFSWEPQVMYHLRLFLIGSNWALLLTSHLKGKKTYRIIKAQLGLTSSVPSFHSAFMCRLKAAVPFSTTVPTINRQWTCPKCANMAKSTFAQCWCLHTSLSDRVILPFYDDVFTGCSLFLVPHLSSRVIYSDYALTVTNWSLHS